MESKKQDAAIAKCPHCGFEGGKGHAQRFHMDNCNSIKARILKEHAYKYLQEIGEYIAERKIDAVWELKFGKPNSHYVLIAGRSEGFANQLERYVDSLVNKEKETAQKVD